MVLNYSQWLKEPLWHFLLAGGLIFIGFEQAGLPEPEARVVLIKQAQINALAQNWQLRWKRPPTETELAGLIDNTIREELYYREAKRLGLDNDDSVVRNRLIQKVQFLQNEGLPKPTREQLARYLNKNLANYPTTAHHSFKHIYLGQNISTHKAIAIAKQLNQGKTPSTATPLLDNPTRMDAASTDAISRLFGFEFTKAINTLNTGQWLAPVYSGFGTHAVFVEQRIKTAPNLDNQSFYRKLENDWRYNQQQREEQAYIDQLKQRYHVNVDR